MMEGQRVPPIVPSALKTVSHAVGDGSGPAAFPHVPARLPADQEAHRRFNQPRLPGKGCWGSEHLPLPGIESHPWGLSYKVICMCIWQSTARLCLLAGAIFKFDMSAGTRPWQMQSSKDCKLYFEDCHDHACQMLLLVYVLCTLLKCAID